MAQADELTPLLPPEEQELYTPARRRIIMTTTMMTSFLSTLDMTIVATCIPTIASELHAFDKEAWIGTAYLWSNVTFTPLYGRLCDIIGIRRSYQQALVLFTVGTALCGLAPTIEILALARFVAGMGGGGMSTVSSVLTAHAFPPSERGFYQGIGFAVFGAGIGLGGPIGGWLTQHFGWRAAFYAQLPIAVVGFVLIRLAVPREKERKGSLRDIDFGGSITLLLSIGSLLLLLQRSSAQVAFVDDWIAIASAVSATLFFLGFIYVELSVARKPILPLSLLRRRVPLCVGIISGIIAIVNFNMIYHLPMVFEIVFGESLSRAGAHILPNSAAMTISAPIMGYIVKRTKRYQKLTVLCCLGPVVAMWLLSNLHVGSSWAAQWLSVLPMGAGFSGLLTLTLIANLNAVDRHEIAVATGFVFVFRSIGQVFGVGISGAVFQTSLATELYKRFTDLDIIDKLRHASSAIKTLPVVQQVLAREAYGAALRNTFLFGLLGAIGVFVTSLFIPDDVIVDDEEKED